MLQFIPPKLTISADSRLAGAYRAPLMNPTRTYVFGSTHIDVGGCSYYRILFISQLLSQIYDHALFNDARLLFSNPELFPLQVMF